MLQSQCYAKGMRSVTRYANILYTKSSQAVNTLVSKASLRGKQVTPSQNDHKVFSSTTLSKPVVWIIISLAEEKMKVSV